MATLTLGKSVTVDAVQSKKGDAVFVERRRRIVAPGNKELREEPKKVEATRNAADEKLRAVLAAAKARDEERKKREAEENAAKELAEENDQEPPSVTYVIEYSDDLDSIVDELNGLVNTITYILIAVALVSVLVTMLLIAIVMYISVQDRTREIGILRSLGARKIDISNIFNVETMLLGLASGIIGVVLSLILKFPVNLIFKSTLGIVNLMQFAWWHAPVLIVGAIIITVISGLIPASIAAKKDPVVALRTE